MNFILPLNTRKRPEAKKTALFRPLLQTAAISVLSTIFCIGVSLSQNSAGNSDRSNILQFLDQTINWYRQIDVERQIATEPDDVIAVNDNRALADQIVRLAFDFARAAVDFTAQSSAKPNQAQNSESDRYQSLMQLAANLDQQVKQAQAELQSDRRKLEGVN